MNRRLRVLSVAAILSSYGWIAFHLFFVGYVTWRLGHFPRVTIDDPKNILQNDSLYVSMTAFVLDAGLLSWLASFALGLGVETAGTLTRVNRGETTGTRSHQWLLAGLVSLLVAPLLGFNLLFWLLD